MPNFMEELMGQRQLSPLLEAEPLYRVPESPDYNILDQRLESFPDEEGYKTLTTVRITTRATVGTPDYVHKAEHARNVMQGYTLGSLRPDRADVFNIDYSPEKLKMGRQKEIDNLDQRLQNLEKRTISDIDLDNMTKPAGEVVEEERVGPAIGGLMERGVTQGLGSMQEKTYDYAAPETQAYIGDVVRTEAVKDPELNDQQRAVIANMTDAQVLEMVEGIYSEAQNQGTTEEDVAEEEAESIIDRLMGNETEEMGWRERLNQLGDPEDINFAPTGLNQGGPITSIETWSPESESASATTQEEKEFWDKVFAKEGASVADFETVAEAKAAKKAARKENRALRRNRRNTDLSSPFVIEEEIISPIRGMQRGGSVQGLASMGRGGDSQLAHVMPGERMVPPGVMDDGMLDAAFVRAGLDPREYTVGNSQGSINPMTGMPEYGLGSFIKRLFKKVKKLAPAIGALVGFAYGGPKGAGIGKAIGGVIKTGDVDFQRALSDFGTGWALGNFATGMGMKGDQGFKSIFGRGTGSHTVGPTDTATSIAKEYGITEADIAAANPNNPYPNPGDVINIPERSMWGWEATAGDPDTVGGFIQSAGAKLAGGLGAPGTMPASLVDEFKNLPMAKKLGVGALGLAALSQTGMFDKEKLKGTPSEMKAEMQGLQGYMNRPLTSANQVAYGTSPFSAAPVGVTQFAQMQPQQKSLTQILQDLREDNLRLPSPSFT